MLSDCRDVPLSGLYPTQNYVGTVSPIEASTVPWSQGQQTLLSKNNCYTDSISKEGNCQSVFSKRLDYSINVGDNILKNNPLLVQLLMMDSNNNHNDAFLLSQQSKTTPRPTTETSFSPTVSNAQSNENQNPDDDEIFEFIEKKLTYFRAQMKARKSGSSSKDSSNTLQHSTSVTSAPRALDDPISKDHREKKASGGSIHSPDMSRVKNHGTAEHVRIMQEAAANISKEEAEDRHVVLQAHGSFGTVQVVKHRPTVTLHPKPSSQKYNPEEKCWRNVNPSLSLDKERGRHCVKSNMMAVDNLPSVLDFSKRRQGTMSSSLETAERESCHTKHSREKLPQTSDSEEVRMHLSQDSNLKTDFSNISSSSREHMKERKQPFTEETKVKKDETGQHKMERGLFDRMSEILKNPMFDDISDEEGANRTQSITAFSLSLQNDMNENLPAQLSRHLANATPAENVDINSSISQFRQVGVQLENISNCKGPIAENGTIQSEISRPPNPNLLLKRNSCAKSKMEHPEACPRTIFVETEDGFEQRPCPKCALDISSLNWEDDSSQKQKEDPSPKQEDGTLSNQEDLSQTLDSGSEDCLHTDLAFVSQHKTVTETEYEEDEWFVVNLSISDLKLEEIIVLDDTDDNEDGGHPLSCETLNQPVQSCFQKLTVFDSLPSFLNSNLLQFNVPLKVTNTPLSVPLASISLPKLGAVEKAASEPTSVPSIEAEDSCDTDDSSDYPLQPKRNYLTASSRVKAPSPLRHVSESLEESEVAQTPGPISPGSPPASTSSNFFPRVLSDEDEDSNTAIDNTITSIATKTLCKHATKTKGKKRCKSATFKKVPCIVSEDDDDNYDAADEGINQNRKLKRRRSDGSVIQAGVEQNDQVPSSVSSKGSSHVDQHQAAKRKRSTESSSSDHIRKARRSSPETESMVQEMPKKLRSALKTPGCKESSDTQNAKTNASNTNQNSIQRQLSQPSSPTKAEGLHGSPLRTTLSLNGHKYHASSLPGPKQSKPEPKNSSPPKPSQQNSYSTEKSTPAKQRLVGEWELQPVPPMVRRRTRSNEQGANSLNDVANMPNRRDLKNCVKRKRNPRRTPLMKKTLNDAMQLSGQTHRQAPTEQNPDNRFEGYKWKTTLPNDLDWEEERDGCSPQHPKGLTEY